MWNGPRTARPASRRIAAGDGIPAGDRQQPNAGTDRGAQRFRYLEHVDRSRSFTDEGALHRAVLDRPTEQVVECLRPGLVGQDARHPPDLGQEADDGIEIVGDDDHV